MHQPAIRRLELRSLANAEPDVLAKAAQKEARAAIHSKWYSQDRLNGPTGHLSRAQKAKVLAARAAAAA